MSCEICRKGGSVRRRRLVTLGRLRKSVVAGSTRSLENWAELCNPCERAFRVFQGLAKADETTAAIVILHKPRIEELLRKASEVRRGMLERQMYGPLGSAPSRAEFQAVLEGFGG